MTIDVLAQNLMDLYYQRYKEQDEFFEYTHFLHMAIVSYSALLQDIFDKSYMLERQNSGVGYGFINPEWYVHDTISLTEAEGRWLSGQLKNKIFSFASDTNSLGIRDVSQEGNDREFIRISVNEKWKVKHAESANKSFWYNLGGTLFVTNLSKTKPIKLWYLPLPDEENAGTVISDFAGQKITEFVLNVFLSARNGTVVDMSNDGNPNKIIETEINNALNRTKK